MLILGTLILMVACSESDEATQEGEPIKEDSFAEEALTVVEKNNEAMNQKDVEAFAKTYVKDMQDNAQEQMKSVIKETDFEHDITSPKVIEESENRVLLSVVQTTIDHTGKNDDIEDIVEHKLVRENGEFKIELSRPGE